MVDVLLADAPEGVDEGSWAAANAAVRAYCGWHVAPVVTETVTLDGSGTSLMFLPTLRLVDLVSVLNDGETVTDPEWSATGVVRGTWTWKFRGVVAEMEHGFDLCPDEVLVVLREAAESAGLAGVRSVTSGSHQVQFENSLSSRQRALLDKYRLVTVA